MAKIPKGRIAIYVILGIVVIIVAVWVLKTRAEESKLALGERVRPYQVADRARGLTKKLEHHVEKAARDGVTGIDDLNARGSAAITEFAAGYSETDSTVSDELTAKLRAINAIIDSIVQLRRAAKSQ